MRRHVAGGPAARSRPRSPGDAGHRKRRAFVKSLAARARRTRADPRAQRTPTVARWLRMDRRRVIFARNARAGVERTGWTGRMLAALSRALARRAPMSRSRASRITDVALSAPRVTDVAIFRAAHSGPTRSRARLALARTPPGLGTARLSLSRTARVL